MPSTADLERMVRGASLRVTRPRVAVLGVLHDHPHADTQSIIDLAREELGDVSHQTVYDVLRRSPTRACCGASSRRARWRATSRGRRQPPPRRVPSCGAIADVDCAVGAAPCLEADESHGYAIDEAEVVYRGLCPQCSGAPDSRPSLIPKESPPCLRDLTALSER